MQQPVVPEANFSSEDKIEITILTYPISRQKQIALIDLLQNEWQRTNVDWIESMSGQHARDLVRHALIAKIDNQDVATASISYPVKDPEVCVIEDVMTLPAVRGRGMAARLTTMALDKAFSAGCKVAYLGNAPTSRPSVYTKCGFIRTHGSVMRCSAPGEEECETEFFSAGQAVSIRESNWGDLPGIACLMDQEIETMLLNFRHGLISPKYAAPTRCVSNFTAVWYDVKAHGGLMITLTGASAYRVLGFASLVPGPAPAMSQGGVIDVAVHDHYEADARQLIAELENEARSRAMKTLIAHVALVDKTKLKRFREKGFKQIGLLPEALSVQRGPFDVGVLEKRL
jgi:GNAT superfamily N-acetyltransferase